MTRNKFSILIILILSLGVIVGISQRSFVSSAENVLDTDGDSYIDTLEIASGYSPFNPEPVKATKSDMDGDGVSDYFEYHFKTDPFSKDTDGDGYDDFTEIDNAYNPLSKNPEKLPVRVEIDLSDQTMSFFVSNIKWREFRVSTGQPSMPTPTGEFTVLNKIEKAWSKKYGLWMPFWLGFDRGGIGIHELPIWPSGYREGESSLGTAVSHGCIRLGVGAAEYVYHHLEVGAKVRINP